MDYITIISIKMKDLYENTGNLKIINKTTNTPYIYTL